MNRCFVMGKIISEPEFKFFYMNKKTSISYFWIKLVDKTIIKVFGYDEQADYIYRKLKQGQNVIVEGKIRIENKNIEIEMETIEKIIIKNKKN